MKKCPYCAEEIQDEAIKCRHCGEMVQAPEPPPMPEAEATPAAPQRKRPVAGIVMGVICAVIFVIYAVSLFGDGKIEAGFFGIGAGVAIFFLAPVGWAIGDAFRKFAHPDFYFAKGAMDLAGKRFFWMFGPQLIGVGIAFGILLMIVNAMAEK